MRKEKVEIVEKMSVPVGDAAGCEDQDLLAQLRGVDRVGGGCGGGWFG